MLPIKKAICIFAFSSLFLALSLSMSLAWEDWPDTRTEMNRNNEMSGLNVGLWLASFYRHHISSIDGSRCPSLPSCSMYSVQAFRKHGFFMGWIITVDRLLHEGQEASISPLVYVDGEWKIYDPLENNDFWWFPKKR